MSESMLPGANVSDLCDYWLSTNRSMFFEEIKRRGLFDEKELDAVLTHKVYVGMSMTAARCSWGSAFSEHAQAIGSSMRVLWSYENGNDFLYIENGKVTGFQH
jgi:hypothetical protein